MTWSKFICLLAAATLFATACDVHEADRVPEEEGTGRLTLSLSSAMPGTKAQTAQEGYAFSNILVVLANEANQVIDKDFKEYPAPVDEDVLSFDDIKVGSYQVYAYANIDHTDWQAAQTIADVEQQIVAARDGGGSIDPDRRMKTLTGSDTPADPARLATPRPMLLTGHKQLSVGVNENIGEVDLLRPVAKLNIYLHNHTAYQVTLKSLSFSNFNASDAYLLDHRTDDGKPGIPDGTTYRELPPYDSANPCVVPAAVPGVEDSGRMLVYSQLLYENRYDKEYRMYADVDMDYVDDESNHYTLNKVLAQKGVRHVPYSELAEMAPGSSMNVMLVNPNTKTGYFYGYMGNSTVCMVANYNFQESFMIRAEDILKKDISSYYCFTLNKNAEGKYSMKVGAKNIFGGTSEVGTIEAGSVPTNTEFPISKEFDGYLVKFKNSAGKFLRNNNKAMDFNNSGTDKGNYMWSLYEVNPLGSAMRLVDNETAQVTPLTCMLRNQELNVVMNVYFEKVSRTFDFEVENAYWTEGHKSSHMFK